MSETRVQRALEWTVDDRGCVSARYRVLDGEWIAVDGWDVRLWFEGGESLHSRTGKPKPTKAVRAAQEARP